MIHSQKVRIKRQSKKLQVQGAQFLWNEAYLECAAMIHPVKSREARRQSRFNRAGDAVRHRNWTSCEAVNNKISIFFYRGIILNKKD